VSREVQEKDFGHRTGPMHGARSCASWSPVVNDPMVGNYRQQHRLVRMASPRSGALDCLTTTIGGSDGHTEMCASPMALLFAEAIYTPIAGHFVVVGVC
jgi:hypothetical protein